MRPIPDQPRRRDAPTEPGIPDLYAVLDEIGASYPLLAYVTDDEEAFEEQTAFDPAIFGGLVRP